MADFSALKTSIQNYIKQNGNEEITGNLLQQILLSMVTTLGDSAINDLVIALNNEVSARQNADGTLQTNINNEATARGNADTQLGNRITSEAETREGADNTLLGLIDGIIDNIENGYVYAGIATPSTTPASGKVFYLALTAGEYTNFGATVVQQGINILKYNGSAWSADMAIAIDDQPTDGSGNLVKSGGVYLKINQEKNRAEAAEGTLQQNINAEKNRAEAAENTLQQNVTVEKNRAEQAEGSLHQEIESEEDKRKQEIQDVRDDVFSLIHNYQPIVIEGNVVNAPDEEDITQQPNNLLKFKDKAYNPTVFSGFGRKYLRKNVVINEDYVTFDGFLENPECEELLVGIPDAILWARLPERFVAQKDDAYYLAWEGSEDYIPVNANKIYVNDNIPYTWNGEDLIVDDNLIERYGNTLTQEMMSDANTIYVIQYDYTLGEDITVPENCILEFDGGSLSGAHTLTGNNTGINADFVKIFSTNVTLAGTWKVAEAYPEWFGAKGDGVTDDRESLQKTIDYFDNIFIAGKVYLINSVKQVTFRYTNTHEGIDETRTWNVGLTIPTFRIIRGIAKQDLKSTLRAGVVMDAVVFAFDVKDIIIDSILIHGGGVYLNHGTDGKTNYGLYLRGSNCAFNRLDVRYCKLDGIYISGYLCTYTECDVHEVQGNGFTLTYHEGKGTTHKLRGCTCDTVRKSAWNISHISYSLFMNTAADRCGVKIDIGGISIQHPEETLYPVYNLNDINGTSFVSCGSELSYLLLKISGSCTNLVFISLIGTLLLEPDVYDFTKVVDIGYALGVRFVNCDFKFLFNSGDTRKIEDIMGTRTFISLASLSKNIVFNYCSARNQYYSLIDRTYICGENALDISIKVFPEDFDYPKFNIPVQGNASVANLRGAVIDITQTGDTNSLNLTDLVGVCNYQYIGSASSTSLKSQSVIKNVNKINFNDCYFILAATYSGNNAAILIENSVVYLNNCIIQQSGSIPEGSTIATSYFKLVNSTLFINNPRFLGSKPIKTFECDKNSAIYVKSEYTDEFLLADPDNCDFIILGYNNREFPISNGSTFYNKLNSRYEYIINNKRADYDGANIGVRRSGALSQKPSASDIYIGFKYFCTDRLIDMDSSSPTYMQIIAVSTTIGGMEINYKGQDTSDPDNPVDVWVDALGRVVS